MSEVTDLRHKQILFTVSHYHAGVGFEDVTEVTWKADGRVLVM